MLGKADNNLDASSPNMNPPAYVTQRLKRFLYGDFVVDDLTLLFLFLRERASKLIMALQESHSDSRASPLRVTLHLQGETR